MIFNCDTFNSGRFFYVLGASQLNTFGGHRGGGDSNHVNLSALPKSCPVIRVATIFLRLGRALFICAGKWE